MEKDSIKRKLSLFMRDSSDSDSKELVVDFFLSWTLRCASEEAIVKGANNITPQLQEYCRRILSVFLFDDALKIGTCTQVLSVKVRKQWQRIDLCAEIILKNPLCIESKHVLLIENKAYSTLRHNQLETYKAIFEKEYADLSEENRHYCYFTLRDVICPQDFETCKVNGFKAYTMDDVFNKAMEDIRSNMEPSGNDIFDEFWLTNW